MESTRIQGGSVRQPLATEDPVVWDGAESPQRILTDTRAEMVHHLGHHSQRRDRVVVLPAPAATDPEEEEDSEAQRLPKPIMLASVPRLTVGSQEDRHRPGWRSLLGDGVPQPTSPVHNPRRNRAVEEDVGECLGLTSSGTSRVVALPGRRLGA